MDLYSYHDFERFFVCYKAEAIPSVKALNRFFVVKNKNLELSASILNLTNNGKQFRLSKIMGQLPKPGKDDGYFHC